MDHENILFMVDTQLKQIDGELVFYPKLLTILDEKEGLKKGKRYRFYFDRKNDDNHLTEFSKYSAFFQKRNDRYLTKDICRVTLFDELWLPDIFSLWVKTGCVKFDTHGEQIQYELGQENKILFFRWLNFEDFKLIRKTMDNKYNLEFMYLFRKKDHSYLYYNDGQPLNDDIRNDITSASNVFEHHFLQHILPYSIGPEEEFVKTIINDYKKTKLVRNM